MSFGKGALIRGDIEAPIFEMSRRFGTCVVPCAEGVRRVGDRTSWGFYERPAMTNSRNAKMACIEKGGTTQFRDFEIPGRFHAALADWQIRRPSAFRRCE